MIKLNLVATMCALLLSTCGPGGEIDATNGTTLRESLNGIVKDMPEVERQRFGQDILLIVEYQTDEIEGIAYSDLFPSNYSVLFQAEEETDNFFISGFTSPSFEQIVLRAGSALNGKTPLQLANDADEIRAAYLQNLITQILAANSEFQTGLDMIPDRVNAHKSLHAETLAQVEELSRKRNSAVSNVRIISLKYNEYQTFPLEYEADITNYHTKPVKFIGFTLTLPLPDIEGCYLELRDGVRLEAEPLLAGETLENVSVTRRFRRNNSLKCNIGGRYQVQNTDTGTYLLSEERRVQIPYGDIDPGLPSTKLREYQNHLGYDTVSLNPTWEQNSIVDSLDTKLKACENMRIEFEKAITANATFVEKLQSIISAPVPIDFEFTKPSTRLKC